MGPCRKVTVTCEIVTPEGRVFFGRNACRNPQSTCPRGPGDPYAGFCDLICQQEAHAEIMALREAREWAVGATAYITFHRERPGHVCGKCQAALEAAGVARVVLVDWAAAGMREMPIGSPVVTRAREAKDASSASAAPMTPQTPPEAVLGAPGAAERGL